MFHHFSHEVAPHQERRWRSGSSRWLYHQQSSALGAAASSPPRAVATTAVGTVLVVGATGSTPTTAAVRGHEACLLPCHGPCSASNQASSCKGFGPVNGQQHRHSPTPSSPASSSQHREAHLMLARKPLRVCKMREIKVLSFPFSPMEPLFNLRLVSIFSYKI